VVLAATVVPVARAAAPELAILVVKWASGRLTCSPSVSTTQALTTSGDGATPLLLQSVSKYRPLTGQGLMPSQAVFGVSLTDGMKDRMSSTAALALIAASTFFGTLVYFYIGKLAEDTAAEIVMGAIGGVPISKKHRSILLYQNWFGYLGRTPFSICVSAGGLG